MPARASKPHRSIRSRLAPVIAIVIAVAVAAGGAAGSIRDLRNAADLRSRMLEAAGSAYAVALADPLTRNDRRAALDYMRSMEKMPATLGVALLHSNGDLLARLGTDYTAATRTADLRSMAILDLIFANEVVISAPVRKGGVRIGAVQIVTDISDLHEDMLADLGWTMLLALAAMAGGLALTQRVLKQLTRPLDQLTGLMREISEQQDLSRRADPSGRLDEAGLLRNALNDMLDSLQGREQLLERRVELLELTMQEKDNELAKSMADLSAARSGLQNPTAPGHTPADSRPPYPNGQATLPWLSGPEAPLIEERTTEVMDVVTASTGQDVRAKLWTLFLALAPDAVFRLERLAGAADHLALARQADAVRAMAASAGARRLEMICEAITQSCRNGEHLPDLAPVWEARDALDATCAAMKAQLAGPDTAAATTPAPDARGAWTDRTIVQPGGPGR